MNNYISTMDSTNIDLDDEEIYTPRRLAMKSYDLWLEARKVAGASLFYMQYNHSLTDWGAQSLRVDILCKELAALRVGMIRDCPEARKLILAWLYRFEDEVENQC